MADYSRVVKHNWDISPEMNKYEHLLGGICQQGVLQGGGRGRATERPIARSLLFLFIGGCFAVLFT